MFNFFIISLSLFFIVGGASNSKNSKTSSNKETYPSGYELIREARYIQVYDYDKCNINYDLIEEYIFRDYVYNFEKISGYTREVAIRKALDKYIKVYGILNK